MSEHEYEVRISDPSEVAAALPHLLGFRPEEARRDRFVVSRAGRGDALGRRPS